jgi:glycosyltransferase involved in cell wall biosynthesis
MENIGERFIEKRVCVLVPTYNNSGTLSEVLKSILSFTGNVIVVNDGSTDDTATILDQFSEIKILGYPQNKGKGFALQTGFRYAYDNGFHYAITIDSDGQHFANDLPVFLQKLGDKVDVLIMGARNMDQASVPGKSNFGKNFSNFWFKFETGLSLSDTQSGYRLYPLRPLSKMSFITRKFEFEIEVLVRAAWSDIMIEEVPVSVFYAEKGKRISHFRPFQDFSRISVLNTILVTIALLYIKPRDFIRAIRRKNIVGLMKEGFLNSDETTTRKSLAVAFGVFMGIAPIWGFQLVSAIALAFLFRLNKTLVILSANISLPPLIPFILYLSHRTGAIWLQTPATISFDSDISLDVLKDSFLQYLLGGFTLAVAAGSFFGLLTFSLLKIFRR